MSRFLARFYLGVANGTFKIVGFGKFWYGLEISAVFVLCLEVSFARCFFYLGVTDFFRKVLESWMLLSSISKSRNFV